MGEAQELHLERHQSLSKRFEGRERKNKSEGIVIREDKCVRRCSLKSSININGQERHFSMLYAISSIASRHEDFMSQHPGTHFRFLIIYFPYSQALNLLNQCNYL